MKLNAVFLLAIVTLTGCAGFSTVDHRQDIAMAALYGITPGKPNKSDSKKVDLALTGALNGRFPRGTPIEKFHEFVLTLGGQCSGSYIMKIRLECSIPDFSMFCFSSRLHVSATHGEQGIENIVARREVVAC